MNYVTSQRRIETQNDASDLPDAVSSITNLERHAAARGDGIRAFIKHFAATTRPEDVRPATRAFLKAAAYLLRS